MCFQTYEVLLALATDLLFMNYFFNPVFVGFQHEIVLILQYETVAGDVHIFDILIYSLY